MQLSFDNLPDFLKPCLLYMGMFPEDTRIPMSKLISLWIAEGLVQNVESDRLMEEAAEGYLMDLISSNMVMVSRRRYNGKVKYCQIHDVVHHFCLEKSREEKFMLAVKGHAKPLDWKGRRVSFSFGEEHPKSASLGSKTQKPFHQHLRSLITTNRGESIDLIPFCQISELRLLKVLDLSSHRVGHLSSATFKPLIHLKYLAVSTFKFDFHPKSHLLCIETLLVNNYTKVLLPASFWEMEKLRHVHMLSTVFDLEGSSKLENLRILRGIIIHNSDRMGVLLRRFPNLQHLEITFVPNCYKDSAEPFCPKLENLTQLQKFQLSFPRPHILSGLQFPLRVPTLQLPSNLKKLVLKGTDTERLIPFIARIPSLEHLQLENLLHNLNVIESKEWCFGDITFHKLKLLKLVDLRISRWDASEESFPLLETLVIKKCDELEEIPFSFADIPTLKLIKLIGCYNKSLEASAVRIKAEVEEIEGCDRIDISI